MTRNPKAKYEDAVQCLNIRSQYSQSVLAGSEDIDTDRDRQSRHERHLKKISDEEARNRCNKKKKSIKNVDLSSSSDESDVKKDEGDKNITEKKPIRSQIPLLAIRQRPKVIGIQEARIDLSPYRYGLSGGSGSPSVRVEDASNPLPGSSTASRSRSPAIRKSTNGSKSCRINSSREVDETESEEEVELTERESPRMLALILQACRKVLRKQNELIVRVGRLERQGRHQQLQTREDRGQLFESSAALSCLPAHEDDQLRNLNTFLENRRNFQNAEDAFLTLGGQDVNSCIPLLMRKIMTTDLALRYNFSGTRGKAAFRVYGNIVKLIRCVIRVREVRATDVDIERQLSRWLTQALRRTTTLAYEQERGNGRNRRDDPQVDEETEDAEEGSTESSGTKKYVIFLHHLWSMLMKKGL